MNKTRLEAFSDGVLAIIITIMVLELKAPHASDWAALKKLAPVFASYVMSFIYIGIYWNNHHHMMSTVRHVTGGILWANLHLLFWLSLIPFITAWMGENNFAQLPLALYGVNLLMSGIAYTLLQYCILSVHGRDSLLGRAVGRDGKGKLSMLLYLIAVVAAFFSRWAAGLIYIFVALMWLVPDRRIEHTVQGTE